MENLTRLRTLTRVAPLGLAGEQARLLRPVPDGMAELFPSGGVQAGWSIGFEGRGSWSSAMMLAAGLMEPDRWLATVGLEELGLVAAAELGVALDRVVMVETPSPEQWATVTAALIEAVDVIAVAPHHPVPARAARRLQARAREQQTVLLHLDGGRSWPQPMDVSLTVVEQRWQGLGLGYGHLQGRRMVVETTGRRVPGSSRWAELTVGASSAGIRSPGARSTGAHGAHGAYSAEVP